MKGFNAHRHDSNPKEKEMHDKFLSEFIESKHSNLITDWVVFGQDGTKSMPRGFLSEREKKIVLSTIQWLGSPVGQGFLSSCGFELTKKKNNG